MDKQVQRQNIGKPNYKKIYQDMIQKKIPDKKDVCKSILEKTNLSVLDVLQINRILFGKKSETEIFNKNHRSYDIETVYSILQDQKENKLNNTQAASKFKISRNTITKWKRIFENNNFLM